MKVRLVPELGTDKKSLWFVDVPYELRGRLSGRADRRGVLALGDAISLLLAYERKQQPLSIADRKKVMQLIFDQSIAVDFSFRHQEKKGEYKGSR